MPKCHRHNRPFYPCLALRNPHALDPPAAEERSINSVRHRLTAAPPARAPKTFQLYHTQPTVASSLWLRSHHVGPELSAARLQLACVRTYGPRQRNRHLWRRELPAVRCVLCFASARSAGPSLPTDSQVFRLQSALLQPELQYSHHPTETHKRLAHRQPRHGLPSLCQPRYGRVSTSSRSAVGRKKHRSATSGKEMILCGW